MKNAPINSSSSWFHDFPRKQLIVAVLIGAFFISPSLALADYSVINYVRTPSDVTTTANQFDDVWYYDHFNFSGEIIDTPWDYALFTFFNTEEAEVFNECVARVEGSLIFDINQILNVGQYHTFQVSLYQDEGCVTPAEIVDTETVIIEQPDEFAYAFEVVDPESEFSATTTPEAFQAVDQTSNNST